MTDSASPSDEPTTTNEPTTSDEPTPDEAEPVERRRRPLNPVSLVVGLLYVAIGLGVIADRQWGGIDLSAVAGASAAIAGIAVIVLVARRAITPG